MYFSVMSFVYVGILDYLKLIFTHWVFWRPHVEAKALSKLMCTSPKM